MPAPAAPATDPQAAIAARAAQTGAASETDQQIIERVESAISHSPMGWLQGLLGDADSKASSERSAAEDKVDEMREEVAANEADAPPDAGPAPQPAQPTTPQVPQPQAAQSTAAGGAPGRPGPEGGARTQKAGGRAPARRGGGAGDAAPSISAALASASGEEDFKAALDNYPNKSQETVQQLARIKQMGNIARNFQGQLDTYVAHGSDALSSAFAASVNFLGAGRQVNAIWDTNPYRHANDTLGRIMTGLSAIKQVTGIVGSICGKLGLILTVVGLLGMIFPPIGTAVSGVARVLNVIGIICDAISFVLSAILTGLNGVRLAKQIAAGGSAEEKAATADLMLSEANDAAGSVINLAMAFGPKFMKGLMAKSKGVINGLMRKLRAFVGNITQRISGSVRGFATRLMRRMGMGGVKARLVNGAWQAERGAVARAGDWLKGRRDWLAGTRVGRATSAAWNAPGRAITRTREFLMQRYGTSRAALAMERFGARAGQLADRMDLTRAAEGLGTRIGNIRAGTPRAKALQEAAEAAERRNLELQAKQAADDARDLEQRRIQYELQQRRAAGVNPNRPARGADKDFLNHAGRQNRRVNAAGREASEGVTKSAADAEAAAAQAEMRQAQAAARFKENPDEYMRRVASARANQQQLEREFAEQEARRRTLLQRGEDKLSDAEKQELQQLNTQLQALDRARARAQTLDQQLYAMASNGGTRAAAPQTAWDTVNTYTTTAANVRKIFNTSHSWETKETFDFKNPTKWDAAGAKANAAGRGGRTDFTAISASAAQAQRADFHNFVSRQPQLSGVAARVRAMLANVGRRSPASASSPATDGPQTTSSSMTTSPPSAATTSSTTSSSTPPEPTPQAEPAPQVQPGANAPPATPAVPATGNDTATADATAEPPAAATGDGPAPDDGGGEPLPYWPRLLDGDSEGSFAHALEEFGFMRRVAIEFKRAQMKGKQEAVDTLETYGRYDEYARARQEAAQQHQGDAQATGQEAQESHTAAGQSQHHGEQGSQKQEEARGQSNQRAPELPEPESRGFWARIIGRIKRWAKQKAAQIFGWLQEKIASVILRGLCGVSMGDLRDYAGALRRQQQAAQGVANEGATQAGQAAQANVQLQGNVAKEAQDAANAIAQCDANIAEADRFIEDVNAYEQQIRASAASAQEFINSLHAEWQAQRQAQQRQAQEGAGGAGVTDAGAPAPAATTAPPTDPWAPADQSVDPSELVCGPDDVPEDMPSDSDAAPSTVAREDIADVHAAARYVSSAADGAAEQLGATKTDYLNQLRAASTNRGSAGADALSAASTSAEQIVDGFQTQVDDIKESMGRISGQSAIAASDLADIVQAIIDSATDLDTQSQQAHAALTRSFETTYQTIRSASPASGVIGAINDLAEPVTDAAQSGLDTVQHGADAAWNTGADAVSWAADPVANAAVTAASYPVGLVENLAFYGTAPVWLPAAGLGYGVASAGEAQPASDEQAIARSAVTKATPTSVPPPVVSALSSEQGEPLANAGAWSQRVGGDVADARVVTGPAAASAAEAIGARAFTVGNRVFFGDGYDPGTEGGNLLAHELTHVVQQRGARPPTNWESLPFVDHDDARESEARAHDGNASAGSSEQAIARDPDPALRAEGEREAARERTVHDLTGRYESGDRTCQLNQAGRTIVGRYQVRAGSRIHVWNLTGELGWTNEGSTGFRATATRAGRRPTGPLAGLARPETPLRVTLVFSGTDRLRLSIDEDTTHELRRVDTTAIRSDAALEDAASLDSATERTPLSPEQREQVSELVSALGRYLRRAFEGDDLMRASQLSQCNAAVGNAFQRVPREQHELFGQAVREELGARSATFDGQSWSLLDWLYVAVAGQARDGAVAVDLGHIERYLQISGSSRSAVDGQMEYRYVIEFSRLGGDIEVVEGGGAAGGVMRVRAYSPRRHGDTTAGRGEMLWEQYYAIASGSISVGLSGGATVAFEDGGQEVTTPFPWGPQDFAGRITEQQARAGVLGRVAGSGADLTQSTSTVYIEGSGVFPPLQLQWESESLGYEAFAGAEYSQSEGYATGGWWLDDRVRGSVADPGAARDREIRAGADVHLGFETDQYTLSARGRQALREVLAWNRGVLLEPGTLIFVEGYASRRYTRERNRFLSEQRAHAVADAIRGVFPTTQPMVRYFGEEAAESAGVPDGDNSQMWRRADVLINGTRVLRLYAADEGDYESRSMAADDDASAPAIARSAVTKARPTSVPPPVVSALSGEQGQPLPDAESWSARVGGDVRHARVVTGPAAEAAAASIGARAFTVGNRVFFGPGYNPASEGGDLLAHELTHVVQQRGARQPGNWGALEILDHDDAREVEARGHGGNATAGSSDHVIARDSEPAVTATKYIEQFTSEIVQGATAFLRKQRLATSDTFASWASSDTAVAEGVADALASAGLTKIREVIAPLELEHLVDKSRKRNDTAIAPENNKSAVEVWPTNEGAAKWFPDVGVEVGSALATALTASIKRLMPRYLAARYQRVMREEHRTQTCLDDASAPEPAASDIIPGHPLDRLVIPQLIAGTIKMDLGRYRDAHPAETVRETGVLRPVALTFQPPQGLWFWVRSQPADATAEEVAQVLYGSPEHAHWITKAGSLFGFANASALLPAHKKTLADMGADPANPDSPAYPSAKSNAGTGSQPAPLDPLKEMLKGPLASEAALAQASGKPTGKSKPAIVQDMRHSLDILRAIGTSAAKFGLGKELSSAETALDNKSQELQAADDATVAKWEAQVTSQKSILGTAAIGVASMVERLEKATQDVQDAKIAAGGFNLPDFMRAAMRKVVAAYVDAAAVSMFVETASERLAKADEAMRLYPVELMEGILQGAQKTIDNALKAKRTYLDGEKDHASYDVQGLQKREQELRVKVAELKTLILNNPAEGMKKLEALFKEVQDLQVETDMVGNMDAIDGAFQAVQDADGIWATIVGDGDELHALRMEAARYVGWWQAVFRAWKSGNETRRTWAKAEVDKLRKDEKFKTFLSRAYQQVKDTRIKTAIAQLVGLLVITVITMGAASVATGVAASLELGSWASLALVAGTETVVFTSLYLGLFEKDITVGKAAGELAFNFALFGALRKFAMMMEAAKLAAPLKAVGQHAGAALILGGAQLAREEIVKLVKEGKHLTDEEIKQICIQGLLMYVAMYGVGKAAAPVLQKLEMTTLALGTKIRAANKAAEGVKAMSEAIQAGKKVTTEQALEYIQKERKWLEAKKEAYEELARVVEAEAKNPPKKGQSILEKSGLSREQIDAVRAELGKAVAEVQAAEMIMTLEQIAPNQFTAPKEKVPELVARLGGQELSTDPVTGMKTYEIKLPDGTLAKLTEVSVPKGTPAANSELAAARQSLLAKATPLADGIYSAPRESMPEQLAEHQKLGAKVESAGEDASGNRVYDVKYPDGHSMRFVESVTAHRPGVDKAPTAAQAEAMRALAAKAAEVQARRDTQLTQLIDAAPGEIVADRIIIGGGQSAVMNYATLKGAKGAPPGVDITAIPSTFAIAPEGSMFAAHGEFKIGQAAPELKSPSLTRQPGEFTADHTGRISAQDFVSALTMTGYETGMVTYKGKVERVEVNPRDGSWPHDTNLRVRVNGKYIYVNHVDGAMGLGAPKPLGRSGSRLAGGEEAKLLASGKMVHAQEKLALPGGGERVAVIGDGATGAWACEAALSAGAKKVYWFGGSPKKVPAPPEVRAELKKLGLTDVQIDTYYRAYNERNAPVFQAVQEGRVELVSGMKDAALVESGPMKGKVEVITNSNPLYVDGIVSAIGSRPVMPEGMGKGQLYFKLTTVVDNGIERVVALEGVDAAENPVGIRLVGSQITAEGVRDQIVETEQVKYDKLVDIQANDVSVPADSRGVPGSVYQTGLNTALANRPELANPERKLIDRIRDGLTPREQEILLRILRNKTEDEDVRRILGDDVLAAQDKVRAVAKKGY